MRKRTIHNPTGTTPSQTAQTPSSPSSPSSPISETYGWVATVAPRAEEEAFRSGLYVGFVCKTSHKNPQSRWRNILQLTGLHRSHFTDCASSSPNSVLIGKKKHCVSGNNGGLSLITHYSLRWMLKCLWLKSRVKTWRDESAVKEESQIKHQLPSATSSKRTIDCTMKWQ